MREQTTIRLTLRMADDLDKQIRSQAKQRGESINQTILTALSRWARLCRSYPRSP